MSKKKYIEDFHYSIIAFSIIYIILEILICKWDEYFPTLNKYEIKGFHTGSHTIGFTILYLIVIPFFLGFFIIGIVLLFQVDSEYGKYDLYPWKLLFLRISLVIFVFIFIYNCIITGRIIKKKNETINDETINTTSTKDEYSNEDKLNNVLYLKIGMIVIGLIFILILIIVKIKFNRINKEIEIKEQLQMVKKFDEDEYDDNYLY